MTPFIIVYLSISALIWGVCIAEENNLISERFWEFLLKYGLIQAGITLLIVAGFPIYMAMQASLKAAGS